MQNTLRRPRRNFSCENKAALYVLMSPSLLSSTRSTHPGGQPGKVHAMGRSKVTSRKAARAASKVLRDKRTGRSSKTAAGSALAQTPKRKK